MRSGNWAAAPAALVLAIAPHALAEGLTIRASARTARFQPIQAGQSVRV